MLITGDKMKYRPGSVSVLIGHLPERIEMLREVKKAYIEQNVYQVIWVSGMPGGQAYNHLAKIAIVNRGLENHILMMAADDQIPQEGCIQAAVDCLNGGNIPCNRLCEGDVGFRPEYDQAPEGQELNWSRTIFIPAKVYEEVGPLIDELSWYIDYDYSNRLIAAGHKLVSCPGFKMHHLHGDQSWLQNGEAQRQHDLYLRIQSERG
jgi:hypothetical protein